MNLYNKNAPSMCSLKKFALLSPLSARTFSTQSRLTNIWLGVARANSLLRSDRRTSKEGECAGSALLLRGVEFANEPGRDETKRENKKFEWKLWATSDVHIFFVKYPRLSRKIQVPQSNEDEFYYITTSWISYKKVNYFKRVNLKLIKKDPILFVHSWWLLFIWKKRRDKRKTSRCLQLPLLEIIIIAITITIIIIIIITNIGSLFYSSKSIVKNKIQPSKREYLLPIYFIRSLASEHTLMDIDEPQINNITQDVYNHHLD